MRKLLFLITILFLLFSVTLIIESCSKGGGGNPPPPPNPCTGVNITVNGTVTDATAPGASDGSIAASASGSTNFTFSINGGAFQASGTFNNLAKGNYTVRGRDDKGCIGSKSFTVNEPNVCSGVTITVTTSTTVAVPCANPANGSITVTASGSSGFTYSLDNGTFQASNVFNSVAPGNHTVTAKDLNGCAGSANATIAAAQPGPLFIAVQTLMQNNCVPCHNSTQAEGGMNWTVDCNIVNNRDRIKARAVDANPSPMPPTGLLPLSERQKITDWINAGGQFTN